MISYAHKSITGHRAGNEDNCLALAQEKRILAAVADGMGGMACGATASRLTVDALSDFVELASDTPEKSLDRAVREANLSVYRYAADNPPCGGMGSTLVGVIADGESFHAVNVGDSRLYQFHTGFLTRITRDHSLVNSLLEAGVITESEAVNHPLRNIITKAIGIDFTISPDYFNGTWEPGDFLLLCSDGLHGVLPEKDISTILSMDFSDEELCDLLVDAALNAGSRDNITTVLIRNMGGDGK